ncbi:MAG TPA: Rossmann-like and DUF2520 domain-containing protein [Bacteroidia bacterium]|nr:Rossmann-like and DUF2520 domain-containing protein [Bacteroidia bacterium]
MQALQVVLIGSGNVATHLGEALSQAGAQITFVYDRKIERAKILARKFKAKAISDVTKIKNQPSLIIIAIKDDAIPGVVKKMHVQEGIVVHTSGSVPMEVLKKFAQYGVLYPLQTFSEGRKIDFSTVPVCIEASDTSTLLSLTTISETISDYVYNLDSSQRLVTHVAAVFANNFTNHLYTLAENLLKKQKLPFDLLQPLILETAGKVSELSPVEAQTGPAVRGDETAIKKHLEVLRKDKKLHSIYSLLSKSLKK